MIYIFDLDGTLANTINSITYFCNLALKAIDLPPLSAADIRYMVGNGRDTLIHRILDRYGKDTPELYKEAGAVYDAEYDRDFMHLVTEYEGMRETLSVLKARGHRLCVCSNKPASVTEAVVKGLLGDEYFDVIYGHTEGVPHKPDPEPALLICQKLNARPEECIFVGDTYVDIETGKNAGMTSVGVLWGFRGRDELEKAGADMIIQKPAELLSVAPRVCKQQ